MENRRLIIGIVAGELSGDILGAGLIRALSTIYPNSHFVGIAGPKMIEAGCDAWFNMEELAVMGIVEVLGRLPRILAIRHQLTKRLIALKPDIVIGIDAPDFNLTLEGKLKQTGIKTIHYVSPSVWAWKQKRVFKIKKVTDLILVFLPFEKVFYDKFGVPCQFIGHKMADDIALYPDRQAARKQLSIEGKGKCLVLLPGSRQAEVSLLSELLLQTARRLINDNPQLTIIVPLANEKRYREFKTIKQRVEPDLPLLLLRGQAREAMIASDAAILASGTVSLECMLAKCPMVVIYKMKPFSYWLATKLVKTPYIALPNILAGEKIVPELIQHACNPETILSSIKPLLYDEDQTLKSTFIELHRQIRCGADQQAAHAVLNLLGVI